MLKPLSCQAIAVASEPGTPCCAAIERDLAALRRPGTGSARPAARARRRPGRWSPARCASDGRAGRQLQRPAERAASRRARGRSSRRSAATGTPAARREAGERVARAHDVAAHRLRGAEPVAAAAAAAPVAAGIRRRVPAMTNEVGVEAVGGGQRRVREAVGGGDAGQRLAGRDEVAAGRRRLGAVRRSRPRARARCPPRGSAASCRRSRTRSG